MRKTLSAVKERLNCDTLSRQGAVITARWSFFYTSGRTHDDCVKPAGPMGIPAGPPPAPPRPLDPQAAQRMSSTHKRTANRIVDSIKKEGGSK